MGISTEKSKGQNLKRPECLLDIEKNTAAIESVVKNNILNTFRRTPTPDSIETPEL